MAQLLVVSANLAKRKVDRGIRKTEAEDHAVQAVGNVIGIFPDGHIFSPTELDLFDIVPITGDPKTVRDEMPRPPKRKLKVPEGASLETKNLYRTTKFWQDNDGTWYVLKNAPKHENNISSLSRADLDMLKNSNLKPTDRATILSRVRSLTKENSENFEQTEDQWLNAL